MHKITCYLLFACLLCPFHFLTGPYVLLLSFWWIISQVLSIPCFHFFFLSPQNKNTECCIDRHRLEYCREHFCWKAVSTKTLCLVPYSSTFIASFNLVCIAGKDKKLKKDFWVWVAVAAVVVVCSMFCCACAPSSEKKVDEWNEKGRGWKNRTRAKST